MRTHKQQRHSLLVVLQVGQEFSLTENINTQSEKGRLENRLLGIVLPSLHCSLVGGPAGEINYL